MRNGTKGAGSGVRVRFLAALCLVCALCGCAAHGAQRVGHSGFLGDYSQLKPGEPGMAAMVYRKPDADMRKYDDIVIDPVRIVLRPGATRDVDPADLGELATLYHEALVRKIIPIYPAARVVGPQTLRLRVAITDVVPGSPVRGVLSMLPVGMVISGATRVTSGEFPDVGQAETEMELLDAVTGERLGAGVDRRVGTKAPFRGSLEDAKDAFEVWADRLAVGLSRARAQR